MNKTHIPHALSVSLALALATASLGAQALTIELQGPAALSGQAGDTVGWGFAVQSDATEWISFIGSLLVDETTPTIGNYTDYIGQRGGPVDFALPPAVGTWLQLHDVPTLQGLGSYTLDPAALVGTSNGATLRVLYERYSANPLLCGGSCYLGSAQADLAVAVAVSAVPEPAPQALLATGLAALGWLRFGAARRRRG